MQTRIQRWGNSLAVRIPRSVAADAQLREASPVDVRVVEGRIIITALTPRGFTLAKLLERVTDENVHAEVSTGGSVGAEEW